MSDRKPVDICSPQFKADPFPFFARLRAEQPVYPTRLLGKTPTAWTSPARTINTWRSSLVLRGLEALPITLS